MAPNNENGSRKIRTKKRSTHRGGVEEMAGIQAGETRELQRRIKELELRVRILNSDLISVMRERDALKRALKAKLDIREQFPDYHKGKFHKSFFEMSEMEMKEYMERMEIDVY